ncbi:hypothetical protein ACVWZA_003250, partial [Sphingomonas sp. UYAg733]
HNRARLHYPLKQMDPARLNARIANSKPFHANPQSITGSMNQLITNLNTHFRASGRPPRRGQRRKSLPFRFDLPHRPGA